MKKIILVCLAALLLTLPIAAMAVSVTAVWQDGAVTVTCGGDGFFQVLIDGSDTGRWLGTGNYVYTWSIPADGREHTVTLYSLSYGSATATFFAGEATTATPEPTQTPTEAPTEVPVTPIPEVTPEQPAGDPTQEPEVTPEHSGDPTHVPEVTPEQPAGEPTQAPEVTPPPTSDVPTPVAPVTARPERQPVVTAVPAATAAAFSGKVISYTPVAHLHDLDPAMGIRMDEALGQIGVDLQFSIDYGAKAVVMNVSELLGHDAIGSYRSQSMDQQLLALASLLSGEDQDGLSENAAAVLNAVRTRVNSLSGPDRSAWNKLANERFVKQPFTVGDKAYDSFSIDVRVTDSSVSYERYTFYLADDGWYLGALYTGVER